MYIFSCFLSKKKNNYLRRALAHRVAGFERFVQIPLVFCLPNQYSSRDIFGEDDFVAQPQRRTRRHRSTYDDDDEEVGDGLSSLEEASSGHSHSDGCVPQVNKRNG